MAILALCWHVCDTCEKESNSVQIRAKGVRAMFVNIRQLCSDAELGKYQELVLCIMSSKY